jgi:squalene cyclase
MDWKSKQNSDGGWAYARGGSWTEPTAFVLMAQSVTGIDGPSFQAGLNFLGATQRRDGGWSPQPGVDESTWVTALAAFLPERTIGPERLRRALAWLKGQTGRESSLSYRLRQRIAGNRDEFPYGWPWFPGAAAWVIPTAFGILAFERAFAAGDHDRALRQRIADGREFLFARQCADGGWNHGSNQALGYPGDSYPETTGIALAALRRAPNSEQIARAKTAARRHLTTCRTAEGIAWLRMGLAAHGEHVQSAFQPVPRTTLDEALTALASAAHNPLLS